MKISYLIASFLLLFTAGCTLTGFIAGNVIDERHAIKKATVSDSLFADCNKGDIILLTDNNNTKFVGKITSIEVHHTLSIKVDDNSSQLNNIVTTFFWNDIKSIHIIKPYHHGMAIGTFLGLAADYTLFIFLLSINGFTIV